MNHRLLSARCLVRAWACVYALLYLFERHQALDVFLSLSLRLANCLSPLIYKFKAVRTALFIPRTLSHACIFIEPSCLLHRRDSPPRWHFISNARCVSVTVKQLHVALIWAVITQCLKISWAAFSLFCASKPHSSRTINSDELLVAFKVDSRRHNTQRKCF